MDQSYLNKRYIYKNGELYWKSHIDSTLIGKQVSNRLKGPKKLLSNFVGLDNKNLRKSHVVWVMHHGPVPKSKIIDHRDQDHLNDRIENLRPLNRAENLLNTSKILQAHNTSGYRGVRLKHPERDKPWSCSIVTKAHKHFKSFETAKGAAEYRDEYIDKYNLPLIKNF